MKRLIAAGGLLVFIIVACVVGNSVIDGAYGKLTNDIPKCISAAQSGDKNQAKSMAQNLEEYWQEKEMLLFIFVNHDTVEDISASLSKLSAFTTPDDFAEYIAECTEIITEITHIKEESRFGLRAVL